MTQRFFYNEWTDEEVQEYLEKHKVLVLFENHPNEYTTMVIHGDLDEKQKDKLKENILRIFISSLITPTVCEKINEYAIKWCNKYIFNRRTRVINGNKGKK